MAKHEGELSKGLLTTAEDEQKGSRAGKRGLIVATSVVSIVTILAIVAMMQVEPGKSKGISLGHVQHISYNTSRVDELCKNVSGAVGVEIPEGEFGEPEPMELLSSKGPLHKPLELTAAKRQFLYHFVLNDGSTMPYYGSADIQAHVPSKAELAVFSFHGAMRNAIDYFCSGDRIVDDSPRVKKENVILLTLKFQYEHDDPDPDGLWWNGSKPWGDWKGGATVDPRSGNPASRPTAHSSFGVIDAFIVWLQDKNLFPNMKEILLFGHSAGGQLVQRYSLLTVLPPPTPSPTLWEKLKSKVRGDSPHSVDVRYVIANPSSYAYLDRHRWAYDCDKNGCGCEEWVSPVPPACGKYRLYTPEKGRAGWRADRRRRRANYRNKPHGHHSAAWMRNQSTGVYGLSQRASKKRPFICSDEDFQNWHYGLNFQHLEDGYGLPYLLHHPDIHGAVENYKKRDMIYLVGQNDTCTDDLLPFCSPSCWQKDIVRNFTENRSGRLIPDPHNGLKCWRTIMDMRCPAMLQGPFRLQRGVNYMDHLRRYYKSSEPVHELGIVPGCGHEAEKIFRTKMGQRALFAPDQLEGILGGGPQTKARTAKKSQAA